jgi:hypothetical protein
MTEFSESNPPVTNGTAIGNDLTIAPAPRGLWFTSTTGNYIGFADGGYVPEFALTLQGSSSVSIQQGGHVSLSLSLSGSWKAPLNIQVSDSETFSSLPKAISMVPSVASVSPGSGPFRFNLTVSVASSLAPGRYTLDVTVSNGLVLRTVFVFLTVNPAQTK